MNRIFGSKPTGPQVRRVAVVLFDPLRLNPDINQLMAGYIEDLNSVSGKQVAYILSTPVVTNEFPLLQGGRRYTLEDYQAAVLDDRQAYRLTPNQYLMLDYEKLLAEFHLLDLLKTHEADEIWLWGDKYYGFWESIMGGRWAFKCNAPDVIRHTCLVKRFVVMGFNFTCGNGEMLESFGHRVEATLAQKFNSHDFLNSLYDARRVRPDLLQPKNDFERFLLEQGTVHRLPKAPKTLPNENDYWWGGMTIREHHQGWLTALNPGWWSMIA